MRKISGGWMLKILGVAVLVVGSGLGSAKAQKVAPVAHLEASQFLGTWFEIARLPNRAEKKCVGGAIQMYAPDYKVGRFQIVDSCKLKDGSHNVRNQSGRRADKSGDGRLKFVTIWPFTAKYWVVGVGPEYGWALLGTPNRKKLWVLSKTAVLPADQLAAAEALAQGQGFNVGKLVVVVQTP
jgi:apolipoprotein D and lipocalin family protein